MGERRGGGGVAAEKTTRPERPAGKIARLTIDLPADLHAKFKAACALKGTRMIDEVRRFPSVTLLRQRSAGRR